ncbi:PTS sugar transporter subunit IIB [Listeria monocytogenes]|uniref:Lichenan-specific phosphotransferase enzyme IIB component n=2 Tax=Bacillales TaxID=1385 RepID=A0AAN2ZEF7_LISMN|nr:PTS sugar transporter subunit IIB [Listeria monocytogenes]EAE3703719.1 PTS sugar transporter subunit IIB [Listeria monocytogenes serotype 1/2c]AEO26068.1 lichenan-specific phosphotransferase enzyme iib component [Listeria monocytogenes FSL R2-561]ASH47383.1 PTS system, cellobiose-specific IIB component [Listeria monocytogenes serotype 1/2c str. 10-5025]ASH50302.1 PTS system, cellobiose-specific IIB component [Listeria monocytogenes serotype 1/2c str. 10-5026]ASH53224.1 PTS system, cellobios
MNNIMLVCSAGMSTSLLVKKMTEAIEKQQVDATVIAVAEVDFDKYKGNVDVVLLAPQVRFLEKNLKRVLDPLGIPVAIINGIDYGTMDGEKVLNDALAMIEK